jgi:hypothetical protein
MFSLISLFRVLQFSFKRYLAFFIKFIPRYAIVFEAIVNGIVSLISFQSLHCWKLDNESPELGDCPLIF